VSDKLLDRLPLASFGDVARLVLETPVYEWIRSGAGDEQSAIDNVAAFRRWRMRPHVLEDVSSVSTAATVLGSPRRVPLLVAPMALQRVVDDEGEIATARAVAEVGAGMIVAVNATTSVEKIRAAAPDAVLWFQLYNWDDRDALARVVERAEAAGCRAIVPLVNTPVGVAHTPPQAGFRLPAGLSFGHFEESPGLDASNTWSYLEWLARQTTLPIVPKGILHPDDARRAVDSGARGILISNHGGRQLHRAMATIDALPEIAAAVGDSVELILDGGIRSGSDVLTALALGARAVTVGRPVMWGLTLGGSAGVRRVLRSIADELAEDAALCGVPATAATPRDIVVRAPA
jgi:4-hydroxymandelate oxidase